MAQDYTEFVELADELLEEFGRDVVLLNTQADPEDANKPWNGPLQFDNTTVPPSRRVEAKAVFVGEIVELTQGKASGQKTRTPDPFLTQFGTDTFLVSGSLNQDIRDFDVLVDGTEIWKIKNVATLKPGDTVVLYAIQVAK